MSDVDLARRLLLAFGGSRFIVFGRLPAAVAAALCDAGSELHSGSAGALVDPSWSPDFVEKACLVCVGLSDEALDAVLSDPRLASADAVYIQHAPGERLASLEALERHCFALGYRKHPVYYRVLGYAELEEASSEWTTLLEPLPLPAASRFPMARLAEERDLHMDMLREAGRRSDAHVIRYDWASKYIRPNDTVLDAACGLGYGTHVMRQLSMGSCFYGIDGSEWAIEYAKACFSAGGNQFRAGMLPDALAAFEDSSVDVVVSFETLEHVASPTALLAEFRRVLRPGGRIVVSVPNDWSDASGTDPNPHHLHVYTWQRLATEIGAGFVVEEATRQIATCCKRLDAACEWVDRPRTLQAVNPVDAPTTEAEWWLAVGMKSPEHGAAQPYRETVHPRFEGATHLVDFGEHYTNPWLVHAMVEIPFRLRHPGNLKQLAARVRADSSPDSADHGAALAVTSYRALEEQAGDVLLLQLDREIGSYLALASDNPHVRRWQVSLAYVRARMRLRRSDRNGALLDFGTVAAADVARITPTLGTKVVDAAFWAGMLWWASGEKGDARRCWKAGLARCGELLGSNWQEFFGNAETPFVFAMNDAVEIVDRATACAQALALTARRPDATLAMLHGIGQQSLRSALRQRDTDLSVARTATAAIRNDFDRVCRELEAADRQNAALERSALDRLDTIHALEMRVRQTEAALEDVKAVSVERLDRIHELEERLRRTDSALDEVKALSLERLDRILALEERLRETDAALTEVKDLSVQRLTYAIGLESRIELTDAALDELKLLSMKRLERIELLERELQAATKG